MIIPVQQPKPQFDLDDIRQRHDLRKEFPFISRPIPTQNYLLTLCPFHQRKKGTPSLIVDWDHWFCTSCHDTGDIISLVQWQKGLDFIAAVTYLQEQNAPLVFKGVNPGMAPRPQLPPMKMEVLDLFSELSEETAAPLVAMGLNYEALLFANVKLIAPGKYAFPVIEDEELLDVQVYHPGHFPKWKPLEAGHGKHLYMADYVKGRETVFICEGCKNTLAAIGIGLVACGTLGIIWNEVFTAKLDNASTIWTLGDKDKAGETLGKKVRNHIARAQEFRWRWLDPNDDKPDAYDIADFVRDGGTEADLWSAIANRV